MWSDEVVKQLLTDWLNTPLPPYERSIIQSLQTSINENRAAFDERAADVCEFLAPQMVHAINIARLHGLGVKYAEQSKV